MQGIVAVNGGQLGLTQFGQITSDYGSTQVSLWTLFPDKPSRYVINASANSVPFQLLMPVITSNQNDSINAHIGFVASIYNSGTQVIKMYDSTGSTLITTIQPNTMSSIMANQSSTWLEISNTITTANELPYNNYAGYINVNAAGTNPSAGSVLAALSASSARWTPLASTGSYSMVYVKNGALTGATEFNLITDALAYVATLTTPTYDSRYVIYIYPGNYKEPSAIVVPSYVYLVGAEMESVRIEPLTKPVGGLGYDFMTFSENSGANFLTIQHVDPSPLVAPGSASNAIRVYNGGDYVLFHKVEIEDCQKGILCDTDALGPSDGSYIYFEFCDTSFGDADYSLKCTDNGGVGTFLYVALDSYYADMQSTDVFIVDGPNTNLTMNGTTVQEGDGIGNVITVSNGANFTTRGLYVKQFGVVLNVPADGGSPYIIMEGTVIDQCV